MIKFYKDMNLLIFKIIENFFPKVNHKSIRIKVKKRLHFLRIQIKKECPIFFKEAPENGRKKSFNC